MTIHRRGIAAIAIAAMFTILGFTGSPVAAHKGGKDVTSKGAKKPLRGADPNIKTERGNNAGASKVKAPPKKGGKAKGAYNEVHVDNRTGYYIDLFLNGDYQGTVAPMGDFYQSRTSGTLRIYGKAPGTSTTWGPRTIDLDDDWTWTLTD